MKVVAICATSGRHTLLERSVGMFLEQDYEDWGLLLIYNNSSVPLTIAEETQEETGRLLLVNNHLDLETGEPYNNLGAIYRDALTHIPEDVDLIYHHDDDDLFLPNHISEGVKGYIRGGKQAYKPAKSYYRHAGGVQLMANTLEPSIFVEFNHLKKYGYSLTTSDQHLQWVNPLVYESKIFVDESGPPTLVYNWGDTNIPTFKTSGDPNNPKNFGNYRVFSKDHGDRVITPWKKEQLQQYYDLVS